MPMTANIGELLRDRHNAILSSHRLCLDFHFTDEKTKTKEG